MYGVKTKENVILVEIGESEIKSAISKSLQYLWNSIKQSSDSVYHDNLRVRNGNVAFDCMVRGFIGEEKAKEIISKKLVEKKSTCVLQTNAILDESGMDVDLLIKSDGFSVKAEIKTSCIPDYIVSQQKNLKESITPKILEYADVKIIRRVNKNKQLKKIEELESDYHIQLFFEERTKVRDSFVTALPLISNMLTDLQEKMPNVDIISFLKSKDSRKEKLVNDIYKDWQCDIFKRFIFAGVGSKEQLIEKNKYKEDTWSHASRAFWSCKLKKDALSMDNFINEVVLKSELAFQSQKDKLNEIIYPQQSTLSIKRN